MFGDFDIFQLLAVAVIALGSLFGARRKKKPPPEPRPEEGAEFVDPAAAQGYLQDSPKSFSEIMELVLGGGEQKTAPRSEEIVERSGSPQLLERAGEAQSGAAALVSSDQPPNESEATTLPRAPRPTAAQPVRRRPALAPKQAEPAPARARLEASVVSAPPKGARRRSGGKSKTNLRRLIVAREVLGPPAALKRGADR